MQWNSEIVESNHIKFDITIWEEENLVWLNNLIIPKKLRGQHLGSKCLQAFTQWLDQNGYDSILLISNCYGTPESVLEQFYGKYGYTLKETKRKNIFLKRIHKK